MIYSQPLPLSLDTSAYTTDAARPRKPTIDYDPSLEARMAAIEQALRLVPERPCACDEATAGSPATPAPGAPDDATTQGYVGANKTGILKPGRNSVASPVDLGTVWAGTPPTFVAVTHPPSAGGDRATQRQMTDWYRTQDAAAAKLTRSIMLKWRKQ